MATFYRRKNGTYCVRVSNGTKDGKQNLVSTTFKPTPGCTENDEIKEVEPFSILFENAVHNGAFIPGRKTDSTASQLNGLTLGAFIEHYYFDRVEKKLSPNTLLFYQNAAHKILIPSFGQVRVIDITAKHLQALIDYLSSAGARANQTNGLPLRAATIKRYATVFSSVMREAHRMGITTENKLRNADIEYPAIEKNRLDVYTAEEAKKFSETLQNEPIKYRALFLVALFLGLRRGELVALRWDDIDFENHCVWIHNSAYKLPKQKQALKFTKSFCSNRTVFFADCIGDTLLQWKSAQDIEKQKAGKFWSEQNFVFTDKKGDMMSIYSPTKIFKKIQQKYDLRPLKLHGLRHTCASLMLAQGTDIETVKDILGHSDIETTKIYLHAYDEKKKSAANAFADII